MFSKKYVRFEGRYFMQRRICPICDHPIKYGHYCSFCKQWIRNPNYVNATYYLNERHPAHETDCEYHNAGSASWETSARQAQMPSARLRTGRRHIPRRRKQQAQADRHPSGHRTRTVCRIRQRRDEVRCSKEKIRKRRGK